MLRDTHRAYEELTGAGAQPELAQAFIRLLQEADEHLATKQDIELLRRDLEQLRSELEQLRSELKNEIEQLRGEFKSDLEQSHNELKNEIELLRRDLEQLRSDLTRDMYRAVVWGVAFLSALVTVLSFVT